MGKVGRFNNVCRNLLTDLKEKGKIREENLTIFQEEVANMLVLNKKPPESYFELQREVCSRRAYNDFDNMANSQICLFGALWGTITLLSDRKLHIKENNRIQKLAETYKDHKNILQIIKLRPHLTLEERKWKYDKDTAFKVVSRMHKDRMLLAQSIGNKTYYFITPFGEKVLEEIKKQSNNKLTKEALKIAKDYEKKEKNNEIV